MYPRLLSNLCERSLCRVLNSFKFSINRLSHASHKHEEKPNMEIVSTRFSDYKIIYTFHYIKHISALNIAKHRLTFFVGAAVPVIVGLQLADIISFDIASSSIASGILLTLWLHSFGIFYNNLIGHIYVKLDEKKVILSYVNYWGKRVDLKTTLNEIIPLSDNPISIMDPLYRKVMFTTRNQKLKINMKFGYHVTDIKSFKCVLGMT